MNVEVPISNASFLFAKILRTGRPVDNVRMKHKKSENNTGLIVYYCEIIQIIMQVGTILFQGSYTQDCVKFKDFSRTSTRLSCCFSRTEN